MSDTSKIPASRLRKSSLDVTPQSGSTKLITSGGVYTALKDKLGTTDTAAKATADADGNVINQTYAKISDVIFYEEN